VPTKTFKTMAQPDAPILIHPSQLRRIWRWGLDFLRASRPGPSWANTRHVLRLSLYSFESLKEIRAATGVQYDAVHRRRPQGLSEPERASMTSPPSSWMTSAAPFITLTAFGPGARPVDEATEATRISVGTASLTVHCGDRPCDRCGRHEQPPNHGAPPTLVVAIAADEP
jgi:D-amino-acid dehydrogenase